MRENESVLINNEGPDSASTSEQWLPVLLLLFVGSGTAALIYEIVWFQLLQLYIGSSAVSLGVLLGTFMGGMCLGSLLLPRVISAKHHPLRVYAFLELGIGVIGILVLLLMPLVGGIYTSWGGYGLSGFLLRGIVASVCLVPPTLLMGATLPAIARWVETTPRGVSWLGFFYGGNIAGAVFGSLLAGFYLLRVYDMATATYVAVAFNVTITAIALALSRATRHEVKDLNDQPGASLHASFARRGISEWAVYVTIALSGFTALAAEVIWTRDLGLLFGASVYTFSLILAAFLLGLGIGSSVGSVLARSLANPRLALGSCQMLLAGAIFWTAYQLTESMPYLPIDPSLSTNIWFNFQLDILRALWAILPAALLWGASFPLALASVVRKGQDAGRLVGGVYAANTVGAIFGALSASLLLVAWIGTQHAQQMLIAASIVAGALMLAQRENVVALAVTAIVAGLLAWKVQPIPSLLVGYGRYSATRIGQAEFIYTGEGLQSSVAVSRLTNGVLNYHNAGKVQASSEPQDMRLQRMLGHLTTLIPREPRSVLVIGCGAGVTAGAVSIDPKVQHVTIAEIEPLVPEVVSTYFSEHNFDVVRNPKVRVQIDDARHFLLTTKEKFDAITSDPLDPWVKGAATLYTKEFFEVAKQHLNPGGAVTLFVQLYESTPEAVRSEIGTFFDVFPNGIIWGNTHYGSGYDTVLLGQVEPTVINLDDMEQRLMQADYAPVARSLGEIGFHSAVDLFATYAGRASDMAGYLKDASINRDHNLRLQYLAGLGLNLYQGGPIYNDIIAYSRFPDGLFAGSPAAMDSLRRAMSAYRSTEP